MKRILFFLLILLMPTLVHALQVEPAAYDFGTVSVGETVIREFRLSNRDDDDLRLFSISLADDPFFRIAESTCGDRLKEKGSCRVRVEFAPVAVGSWATDLVIVSDDGDQPETIVHLQGTGRAVTTEPPTTEPPTTEPPTTEPPTTEPPTTEPPTTEPPVTEPPDAGTPGGDPPALSGILIRDSVEPYDDRTIPFGTVPVGVAKRKIFQIGNRNEAEMEILLLTPPSAPFSIENDGCSGAKLDFMDSCSVEVVFTPTIGDQTGDLTFSSTAPGENLISIAFSGSGIAQTDDFPAPVLIHPDNGSTNMKDEVTFRWSNCRDANGKLANYRLHAGPQPILPEMPIRRVLGTEASLGLALGGLYFLFRNGRRGRPWRWISLALLASVLLFTACSEDIEDSSIEEVGNLADESTYYWQVVAEYDDGIEAKSEVRSFTTR